MNSRKLLIAFVMTGLTAATFAQDKPKVDPYPAPHPRKTKDMTPQPRKTKDMTPLERKKAGVQRTLKEKNFHFPDTTGASPRNR
jgi:hypothetical protein